MDQLPDELSALGRIISAIKVCRRTAPDQESVSKTLIETYLKQHLSRQDWLLWEQLNMTQEEEHVGDPSPLTDQSVAGQSFRFVFNQYRRAGYEHFTYWLQSLTPSPAERLR